MQDVPFQWTVARQLATVLVEHLLRDVRVQLEACSVECKHELEIDMSCQCFDQWVTSTHTQCT